MRKQILGLILIPAAVLAGIAACGDDSSTATNTPDGGNSEASTSSSGGSSGTSSSGGTSSGGTDSGSDSGPAFVYTATKIASFDATKKQLPEGVTVIPKSGSFGTPIVSFTPTGFVAEVTNDAVDGGATADAGGVNPAYGPQPANWSGGPSGTARQLGLTADTNGNAYMGIGSLLVPDGGSPTPPIGIYKIPAGGGAPQIFGAPGVPLWWPSGLELVGTSMFIADGNGFVWKMDMSNGNMTKWSSDPILAGNKNACPNTPLATPRPFGATWLTHDANNLYVTNFDYGALIKIPIMADGSAGTPAAILQGLTNNGTDCTYQGIKGVVMDTDGSFIAAVSLTNQLVRIGADGKVTKLLEGKPPFDQLSGLFIDTNGKSRRLLVTNFALQSANAGANPDPALLSVALPDAP